MMIDPVYRLDLYGLSSKLSQRHWAHLVQEHFSDHPDVVAKAKAALTAEESAVVQAAFGNVQYKWARERQPDGKFIDKSFDGMLKDIDFDQWIANTQARRAAADPGASHAGP